MTFEEWWIKRDGRMGHSKYLAKAAWDAALVERDDLKVQIYRLAYFILKEIPGEPSQIQGPVDTAIRIMGTQKARLAEYVRRAREIRQVKNGWHFASYSDREKAGNLIRDLAAEKEEK